MRRTISSILLLFCLSSFQLAAQVVPLPVLINPDSITVDNHQIYITDKETIYIFSVVDFKLKTKFGKEGEGPKEFKINPAGVANLQLDIHPDTYDNPYDTFYHLGLLNWQMIYKLKEEKLKDKSTHLSSKEANPQLNALYLLFNESGFYIFF